MPDVAESTPTEQIVNYLESIEEAEDVDLLFAVESGSRAWGMDSVDSDFDVRGVYARPTEHYVTTRPSLPDVIEKESRVMTGEDYHLYSDLDVALWDVQKFCSLLYSGNAAPREWLESPIWYKESPWSATACDPMVRVVFWNPCSYAHHYVSLAKNNYQRYVVDTERPLRKKYIYIVRALVQAQRIWDAGGNYVPVCFDMETITEGIEDAEAREAFDEIVGMKQHGKELGRTVTCKALEEYVNEMLDGAREKCNALPGSEATREDADWLFREAVLDQ